MAKQRIKREKDFGNGAVKFTVIDSGETLDVSLEDVCPGVLDVLKALEGGERIIAVATHGLNAIDGDAAADKSLDAIKAMTAAHNRVVDGTWPGRAGVGDGGTRIGVRVERMAKAIARTSDVTEEDAKTKLMEMEAGERKEFMTALPKKYHSIKLALADIELEEQKAKTKALAKEVVEEEETPFSF